MRSVLLLFVLLFCVPVLLYEIGAALLIVLYLFALNVLAGQRFWMRRPLGAMSHNGVALAYLVSGVMFFAVLIEPVGIGPAPSVRMQGLAALIGIDRPASPGPSLVGATALGG